MTSRLWIHGLGRSGTSWALKIFDHHPWTFCSHEPEFLMKLPVEIGAPISSTAVAAHLDWLFTSRALRAMRIRPILKKAYRGHAAYQMRRSLIYGLAGLSRTLGGRLDGVEIPDLASAPAALHVVKSVGHQYVFDRAITGGLADGKNLRVLYLIRHPCGNVSSNLRGVDSGKMPCHHLPAPYFMEQLAGAEVTATIRAGKTDELERLAWRWSAINGAIVELVRGNAGVRVLRYEDICDDPIGVAKDLFAWCGLDWHLRAEDFLTASLGAKGDSQGYHDLTRNPAVAARKWKTEMATSDIDRVLAICRQSPAFDLYANENTYQ